MRRMEYRALAAALCVAQGAIWLAIQPGFPLMGDITGVDDGSLEQGLAILIPAAILGWRFAVGRGSWGFLAWNAVWAVLWAIYSIHHLGRWAVYGEGNVVLLVPELFLALHALALVSSLAAPRTRTEGLGRASGTAVTPPPQACIAGRIELRACDRG